MRRPECRRSTIPDHQTAGKPRCLRHGSQNLGARGRAPYKTRYSTHRFCGRAVFLKLDDAAQSPLARSLFEQASNGECLLILDKIVIVETVWVLRSVYDDTRERIANVLAKLVIKPGIRCDDAPITIDAIIRYRTSMLDIVDCFLAAQAAADDDAVATFDQRDQQSVSRPADMDPLIARPVVRPRPGGMIRSLVYAGRKWSSGGNAMAHVMRVMAVAGVLVWHGGMPSVGSGAEPDPVARDQAAYAGTWRAVTIEADGTSQPSRDRNIIVVNRDDGTWTMTIDGREASSGTSTIDPLATPAEIDIEITVGDGAGSKISGIYELGENRRRLCFRGAGEWRPRDFVTEPGSKAVLVTFERE